MTTNIQRIQTHVHILKAQRNIYIVDDTIFYIVHIYKKNIN